MTWEENIEKEEYERFVKNNPYKSHFLQSYAWGQFAKLEKHLEPHYVGLREENGNLCASTLLLEKKLPFGYSYFYAPRGFVMDLTNESLLSSFTKELVSYVKRKKGIFLKVDPDIILKEENNVGEPVPLPYSGEQILNSFKKLGYHHLGFTKNFETFQPRYTFRINLEEDLETIEGRFHKSVLQRMKKAEEYEVEVSIASKEEVRDFYRLMKLTENRKDFVSHELSYYETLFNLWNEENTCTIFLGRVDLDKIITKEKIKEANLGSQLAELSQTTELSKSQKNKIKELERQLEKVKKDLEKYQKDKSQYGSKILLNGHFIIEYGDKAWVLYAGNHNILTETGANYKTYQTHLEACKKKGLKLYDQFGTIGDLREENPLYGLHDFKKKFGGNYCEFIGEFDYVTNKLMYFVFTKLVPIYRKMVKKIAKKENKKEVGEEV